MSETERGREKILDKLKKMLAHKSSAEAIGSEAEAQAFAVKIQELLSLHKVELSEVEARKLDEVDPVERRLVDFASASIPLRKGRIAWHEAMASIVCGAHFCKFIVCTGSSALWFVGRGTDVSAAEQVFLYLLRVAANLADVEYVKFFHECRKNGDVAKARGYRGAYLAGFTGRLAERYEEERRRMREQWASSQVALVRLRDAIVPVDAFLYKLRAEGSTRLATRVRGRSSANEAGYNKGRVDAEDVPLGENTKQVEV